MSEYDYGNARLRAMRSRLLSQREIETLAEIENIQGLVAALNNTAYQNAIESTLAYTSGMECILQALRNDLIFTLEKIHQFFDGSAGEAVARVLRSYDIHNLKTILRGLANQKPHGEIMSAILPIGLINKYVLTELARSPGPRAMIDLLATLGLPYSQPLLKLQGERPGAGVMEMELALEQWHFHEAFQKIRTDQGPQGVLHTALQIEADLTNLLTIFRFIHSPEEYKNFRQWLDTDQISRIFVGPGKLPFGVLSHAGLQDEMAKAIAIFDETIYAETLHDGLELYGKTGRLSDIERQLNSFRTTWMVKQIYKDSLGIGVLLGFLALKTNEVVNIRLIAYGIQTGLKPEEIRAGMEFIL